MSRNSGSFGMVILVVVMAVVLLLVAQAWKKFGGAAIAVSETTGAAPLDDHGQSEAGAEIRSGRMPRLHEAQATTDSHAGAVQDALAATE